MIKFDELSATVTKLPNGPIPLDMRDEVIELIEQHWDKFAGSDATGMEPWKISRDDGPKDLTWDYPKLQFTIDRHGAAVMGSKRAERQTWTLDLETRSAVQHVSGYRQLQPNSTKLDVAPIAKEVCEAVRLGPNSASELTHRGIIVWMSDDKVRVKHADLVPRGSPKQTISARRKRLRKELESVMKAIGWEFVSVSQWMTFKKSV